MTLPYNGTRTHPPTPHTLETLRALARAPILSYLINPGVRDRLGRGENGVPWAEPIELETTKGRKAHYQITDAGRKYLEQVNNGDITKGRPAAKRAVDRLSKRRADRSDHSS